jgi:phospholipid/cholesterol/gamma-HCH transport system substrate-binding protein
VVPDDGFAHLGLALNLFDPYACVRGYQGTIRRSGTDLAPVPANRDAYCAEPPGSPTDVRGAQNVPRAGTPAQVLPGGSGQPNRPQISSLASILDGA